MRGGMYLLFLYMFFISILESASTFVFVYVLAFKLADGVGGDNGADAINAVRHLHQSGSGTTSWWSSRATRHCGGDVGGSGVPWGAPRRCRAVEQWDT